MTLAISLSPSAEERLAKKAKAEGIDLPTLANLSWVSLVPEDQEALTRVSDKLGAGERAVIALALTKPTRC